MRAIRAALALCAVLVLSGCYVTTSHPIGTTAGLKPDPALTGSWKGVDQDGKPTAVRFLPGANGSIAVAVTVGGDKGNPEQIAANITTAALGSSHFMNTRLLKDGKPDPDAPAGTIPLLYVIDLKGTLTVAMTDEKAVKDAVRAGKLKGVIAKGEYADVAITADVKTLDAFFASRAGAALFGKPFLILHRIH